MPIQAKNLTYVYNPNSPMPALALDHVDLRIEDGEFIGLIGHTGSGKSTLVQHFNALLKPTAGQLQVGTIDVTQKGVNLMEVRRLVGLVFQYPEYQLFEETAEKDVAFGPRNLKLPEEEIARRVHMAFDMVHLDYEQYALRSPFEMSGGQKRRLAIAGVLAMEPDILVMDEPIAGLDPRGREEITEMMRGWHRAGKTLIMVSHSMDDVASLATRVLVMQEGRLVMQGRPGEIFARVEELRAIGLDVPATTRLVEKLRARGFSIPADVFEMEALADKLAALLREEGAGC